MAHQNACRWAMQMAACRLPGFSRSCWAVMGQPTHIMPAASALLKTHAPTHVAGSATAASAAAATISASSVARQAAGPLACITTINKGVAGLLQPLQRWQGATALMHARMLSTSSSSSQQQQQQQQQQGGAASPPSPQAAAAAAGTAAPTAAAAASAKPSLAAKVGELLPGVATAAGVMIAGSWAADIGGCRVWQAVLVNNSSDWVQHAWLLRSETQTLKI